MASLAMDVRYAMRTLSKNPGFAAVAIVTLALGIGANTAIFSVVNAVLLRPLPFADPDRLVRVYTTSAGEARAGHAAADFIDLRRENQSLAGVAGYRTIVFTAVPSQAGPQLVEGAYVTIDFFDVLGVRPVAGRTFSRSTDKPADGFVVLSDEAWAQLFARREEAIGEQLKVDGQSCTLIGVVPARSEWPAKARIWVLSPGEVPPPPVQLERGEADRDVRYFDAIGRLGPGITHAQAGDDIARVSASVRARHSRSSEPREIRIAPIMDDLVGDVQWALLVLQGAVGLVLLIACANVSSLLLARAAGRRRELAIRAALGAGRLRMIRQLLTESLVLGIVGGFAGLLLGGWLTVLLVRVLPRAVPRAADVTVDVSVATATLVAALVTGALFGVLPALQASRTDAHTTLKQSGDRGSSGRARGRAALVIAEVALTLVLLVGAGLLLNSFLRLQRVDSGFDPDNVTLVSLVLPQSRYATAATRADVYRRLIEGVAQQGDVQAAGVGFPGPLRGSNASGTFFLENGPTDPAKRPFANIGSVSAGYLPALGIPVIAGRNFRDGDTAESPAVALVSASFARRYWPGENAVGKRLRFDDASEDSWITVVGVAGDARQLGLHEDAPPILYIPYTQFALPFTNLAVRSSAPAGTVATLVRAQLSAIDPELPPGPAVTLDQVLDRSVEQPRFRTTVLVGFASLALVLAAVGVYGLIGFSVAQRTREIGIRVALGARPRQVMIQVIREGLVLAVAGVAIGLVAALAASRAIASFLFGIDPFDPVTFGGVAVVLLAVAFLACYIPSRKALSVDPIVALRTE